MADHENLTVRLWDAIHDARATPSGHAPTSAIVAAVLPIVEAEVRKAKAEAWDEGAQAQADTYGGQIDTGPNPYRTTETGDQA